MTIKITTEQLEEIVSRAVSDAISRIKDIEVVDEIAETQTSDELPKAGKFTDEQYREAMAVMAANRRKNKKRGDSKN